MAMASPDGLPGMLSGTRLAASPPTPVGTPLDALPAAPPGAKPDSHAIIFCALDNLSPVTAVTVRLDNGVPFSVAVDDRGLFSLPAEPPNGPRHHAALVTATSVTGRSLTVQLRID
jgi:hypothetical protein